MTHQILIKLNQTFITPFDREDIHLLASSLDDVLDFINGASDRLLTYKITQPSPSAKVLAAIILKQAEELGKAVRCWARTIACWSIASRSIGWKTKPTRSAARPSAVCSMASYDPITLIKLKELLEILEEASDKAEDVANVLETVVLKNA